MVVEQQVAKGAPAFGLDEQGAPSYEDVLAVFPDRRALMRALPATAEDRV